MERIEKTLLLPLLAAAVLSSASCSDDKEKEPPVRAVNYTIEFTTVLQAFYLGDRYRTGDGNYRLTLTNADGDVLEADLTSVKAPKPSAAMPEAGVYTAAETRRAGTFAPEASSWETAKSGVEVRSANQAGQKTKFAIRAGSMTLAPAASGDGTFTLSGEVNDGDKTALAFSWSGALAFANESGEEDPVVYERLSMVFGDYYPNDYGIAADTYMLRGGNERVELHSQLRSVPAADPAAPANTRSTCVRKRENTPTKPSRSAQATSPRAAGPPAPTGKQTKPPTSPRRDRSPSRPSAKAGR